MRSLRYIFAGVLLVAIAGSALAFEEQQSAPSVSQGTKEAPKSAPNDGAGAALTTPDTDVKGGSKGTEVRIPGLGKLGVLPKMDFGLELLYGAAELEDPKGQEEPETLDDDLRIRGTIKHRF